MENEENNSKPCAAKCESRFCNEGCVKGTTQSFNIYDLMELDRIHLPHLFETCHTEVTTIKRPQWLADLWERAA